MSQPLPGPVDDAVGRGLDLLARTGELRRSAVVGVGDGFVLAGSGVEVAQEADLVGVRAEFEKWGPVVRAAGVKPS